MNTVDEHPMAGRVRAELNEIADATPVPDDMWLRVMDAANVVPTRSAARRWQHLAIGAACAASFAVLAVVAVVGTNRDTGSTRLRAAGSLSTTAPAAVSPVGPTATSAPSGATQSQPSVDPQPGADPQPAVPPVPETTLPPGPTPPAPPVEQIRKTIRLRVGDSLAERLAEASGGGYRWEISVPADGALVAVATDVEVGSSTPDGVVGSGTTVVVTVRGVAPGSTSLELVQRRPFAPSDVIAVARYDITVE